MRLARISVGGAEEAVTRGESVADALKRMIQSGEIAPGTPLRQAELARLFGTSITPVREAIPVLIQLGLVRKDSLRSPVVARPTIFDLRNNIEIRAALEPLAARRAAERITPEVLKRLDSILERPNEALDTVVHFGNDRDFHSTISAAAGNPQLADIVDSLRDAAYVYLQFEGPPVTQRHLESIGREHRAIVDALRRHDGETAERLLSAHLRASLERAINR